MKRHAVQSSMIRSLGYDPDTRVLQVEFVSGGVYDYSDVSLREYHELCDAPSIGTWFARHIKNAKSYKKVPK